jgi:hypothetical protein
MPEALLLDRDEAQAAEAALGQVLESALRLGEPQPPEGQSKELLATVLAQQTQVVLPLVLRFPEQVRRRWEQLRSAGWQGRAEEVHAARAAFLKEVEGKIRLAGQARRGAELLVLLAGQPPPAAPRLAEVEEELRRFQADVFERWQTLEDLEDLLAASFPLSGERLEALGKQHQAPPAWYSEEGKPF